jgi:hypothetical protein
MKRKTRYKLPYKVDRHNKEAYQILLSRFSPRVSDFNSLLLCVGEGMVRLGKVTNATVLLTDFDFDPDLSKALSFDHESYPAISKFLDKAVWGSKEKALSIILGEAVQIIISDDKEVLNTMIAVGSAEWEELDSYSLLDQSLAESVSSLATKQIGNNKTRGVDQTELVTKELDISVDDDSESDDEIEVDYDMLSDLSAEFDMEMQDAFNGDDVDAFEA